MDDPDEIYESFGRFVASRRKRLGMTQVELAKLVGLSRGSIAHIEKGSQKVFLHHVYAISEALELSSVHELLPTQRSLNENVASLRLKIRTDGKLNRALREQVRTAVGNTIRGSTVE